MQDDAAAEVFHGKFEAITDLVTFEAEAAKQLRPEFERAVDDYLALCAAVGKEPSKTFTGSFSVRPSRAGTASQGGTGFNQPRHWPQSAGEPGR